MSASDGGGGSWKSGQSKVGCVNTILKISSEFGQFGERGQKSEYFVDVIYGCSITLPKRRRDISLSFKCSDN